jgi:hypothetical protein
MGNDLDLLLGEMTANILSLSRRVDELERQEASSNMQISGAGGLNATVFPFGEFNSEPRLDDISVQFQYPYYNTDFDLKPAVIVGAATAVVADGYLELTSTGTDSVIVESKHAIRYMPGHSGYGQFTASFSGAGSGYAGVLVADTDGFYIKLVGGVPHLGYAKDGTETNEAATGRYFPGGEIDITTIDWSKINIFRIMFGYLGVANPAYQIKLGGRWQLLGTLTTEGVREDTHISNPVLPITVKAEGAMRIRTASWNGGHVGILDSENGRPFEASLSRTLSGTNLATFGTFRCRSTYQTVANRVPARLTRYHFFIEPPASGTGVVEFRIRKNATLAGVPSWTNIDTNNSIIEYDTTGTYSSGGRGIFTEYLVYSSAPGGGAKTAGEISAEAGSYGLYLLPGETATITAQNVQGTTNVVCRVVFNWRELF